jgi:ABC-type nickel/cobalt efflux system permease component RcnA
MTDAAWFLEISSYVFVTAFGAWLLWKKAKPAVLRLFGAWLLFRKIGPLVAARRPALAVAGGPATHLHEQAHEEHAERHDRHAHDLDHSHHGHGHVHHHRHSHAPGEFCAECGHSHAPDPAKLGGAEFDWHTAWSAIMAVGLRPCTGALIVLTFAFLNGLWAAGIASVLAMSIGTAITVSALATAAVLAKNFAVRLAGGGAVSGMIQSAFEIGGALVVFLLGLTLLAASLQGVHLAG